MKILCSLIIIGMCFTGNVVAEEHESEERAQLKSLLVEIESAINKQDIDQLASRQHEDVVVTFLNAEVARGIPAVRAYFEKTLGGENALLSEYRTQAKESAPATIYDNVALADGSSIDEFVFADGSIMTVNMLWSTAVVRQDGQWKVAQLHFSTNVFDNPLLATAEKSIAIFSAVALVLGLIIGFVVGRKTAK